MNLIDCAKKEGIEKFVLVSSIGTDDGLLSPLGPILFWKKRAEEHLQRSSLRHTIVRPGGLVTDSNDGAVSTSKSPVAAILEAVFGSSRSRGEGNLVFGAAGAFGLPPKKSGSVKRSKVRTLHATAPARASAMSSQRPLSDRQPAALPLRSAGSLPLVCLNSTQRIRDSTAVLRRLQNAASRL